MTRTVSYDNTFGMADLAVYASLMADDNKDQINRLKRNLTHALRQDVTQRQRGVHDPLLWPEHEHGGHRPPVRSEQIHRIPHAEAGEAAPLPVPALRRGQPAGAGGELSGALPSGDFFCRITCIFFRKLPWNSGEIGSKRVKMQL